MKEDRLSEHLRVNRAWWNERVPAHAKSSFHNLEGFKEGELSLMPLERHELGDVAGRSLLHLQCHFGLDTLSWARLGAEVTGIDFSEEAIALARSLSAGLGQDVPVPGGGQRGALVAEGGRPHDTADLLAEGNQVTERGSHG